MDDWPINATEGRVLAWDIVGFIISRAGFDLIFLIITNSLSDIIYIFVYQIMRQIAKKGYG